MEIYYTKYEGCVKTTRREFSTCFDSFEDKAQECGRKLLEKYSFYLVKEGKLNENLL